MTFKYNKSKYNTFSDKINENYKNLILSFLKEEYINKI
jgi:hypothetical protein